MRSSDVKVLVTGATGFLGTRVVRDLLARGHEVRALVRATSDLSRHEWRDSVEVHRADLRNGIELEGAFAGIDVLIHLAAALTGDNEARWQGTVVATENLLEVMKESNTSRLVLASSFSCYDWSKTGGTITEQTPLEDPSVSDRDGYAIAKVHQERLTRRYAQEQGWDLRVVRPGFIWGRGNEWQAGIGQSLGRHVLVIAPRARIPLTHVDNCAEAFALIAERDEASGQTFNLVDGHGISSWRLAKDYQRGMNLPGWRLPFPYWSGLSLSRLAYIASRCLLRPKEKLPGLFVPRRFQARFRPVKCEADRFQQVLGWSPPYTYEKCLQRTFGPLPPPPPPKVKDV